MKRKGIGYKKHRIRDYLRWRTKWFLPLELRYRPAKIKWGRKFGLIPPYQPATFFPNGHNRYADLTPKEFEAGWGSLPSDYDISEHPKADIGD